MEDIDLLGGVKVADFLAMHATSTKHRLALII
jgi:hypothetical protein